MATKGRQIVSGGIAVLLVSSCVVVAQSPAPTPAPTGVLGTPADVGAHTRMNTPTDWGERIRSFGSEPTVKIKLADKTTVRGKVLSVGAEVVHLRKEGRFFRHQDVDVPFSTIRDVSHTHPTRGGMIALVTIVALLTAIVFTVPPLF
jgi:hypothetical protein